MRVRWYTRWAWVIVLAIVLPVALLFGTYRLLKHFFLTPTETTFSATLSTAELRFVAGEASADPDEAGFLSPTLPLDVEIVGCSRLESQDRMLHGAREEMACTGRRLRLSHAGLKTLRLANGTEVTMSIKDQRLHLKLPATATAILWSAKDSRIEEGTGSRLDAGEWRVVVANVALELIFSTPDAAKAAGTTSTRGSSDLVGAPAVISRAKAVGAGASEADSPIPTETDVTVKEGSQMLFETNGRSALVGDTNVLNIARVKDAISLKDSRLELSDLRSTKIRNLNVDWSAGTGFSALRVLVSGRSDQLLIRGVYIDAGSSNQNLPVNEALSEVDTFTGGGSNRALVQGATALAAVPALLTALVTLMKEGWALREKIRDRGKKKGEGH